MIRILSEILGVSIFSFLLLFLTYFKVSAFKSLSFLLTPPSKSLSLEDILFSFGVALFLILVLVYILRKRRALNKVLFKILLILALFIGNSLFWEINLGSALFGLVITLALIGMVLKFKLWLIHDLALIFALVGMGFHLGILITPLIGVALLVFLSVYDFVAVYFTKHMVDTAKAMIQAQAPLGLILPKRVSFKAKTSDLLQEYQEDKAKNFIILGAGDLLFPLSFLTSVLFKEGLEQGIIVALFSVLGILLSIFIFLSQSKEKPMPALPPIALMILVGYLVAKLI